MGLPPEAPPLPQHLLDSAILLSDRTAMLRLLPKGGTFVEVGIGLGDFSQAVMELCSPDLFVAIDSFRLHELETLWGQPTATLFGGKTHLDAYSRRFAAEMSAGRLRVIAGESHTSIEQLDDGSVDVMYIDADHLFESVRRDLSAAYRKMRPDGWIIMNDYIMVAEMQSPHAYGVVNATNEFMIERDWGIQYFALQTRMFCDVALRPMQSLRNPQTGLTELIRQNEALRHEISALRRSRSWRALGPLRGAVRFVRRIGR